jgi:hypothetical protein
MKRLRSLVFLLPGALLLPIAACTATVVPVEPVGTYEVTSTAIPMDIEAYPHTYFDGRPVYLYSGRWYYRGDGGRWRFYSPEPQPLFQYRQRNYVQQAPPAPRGFPQGPVPPPAVRTY